MKLKNTPLGFTMIELLIVMAIVSSLMALVGPLVIDSYEKAQAKVEMQQLNNYISRLSYGAFADGQAKVIRLEGKQATIFNDSDEQPSREFLFEHLFFQPQEIYLNTNGFTVTRTVDVQIRGKTRVLTIELGDEHERAY